MKKLYRYVLDCGRNGTISGVFVANDEDIKKNLGKDVYFDEVLGKHSEIIIPLEEEDLEVLTEDQDFISEFESIVGSNGYNPLDYIS